MIEFAGVSKAFRSEVQTKLLRAYVRDLFGEQKERPFFALRNVSFRVEAGECVGVIGRNGAGKSTLLGLVAGLAKPTSGRVRVDGHIAALLELGSGFHPELTGVENLWLNASLLGISRKRTAELYDSIVAFADIGDFIREPLRTYSTGMMMRLAFSVAINVAPDILIVDEVLAVGDQAFQLKCLERIREFRKSGRTLLMVSHSAVMVREVCDRAIWLSRGEVTMDGKAGTVLQAYTAAADGPA